jgi:uncharacterized protein YodC (DUF2158 family)
MAFEPGDVVMLKSGGHSMTVVTVEEEDIDCLWVGDDGQMFRQSIPAIALTVVEGIDLDETDEAEDEEAEDKDNEEDDEHEDEDDDEEADEDEEEEEDNKKRAKRR